MFSDNVSKGLSKQDLYDFKSEYPQVQLEFKRTCGTFHDRFIVLDYGLETERIVVCGASSKDAGNRTTVVFESGMNAMYHSAIDALLQNEELRL